MSQKVRKELSRRDLALRGLLAIVVVALFLTYTFMRSTGAIGGPDHVSAQLRDAGGSLPSGADVKVRGVIVGRVTGITAGPQGGVRVAISIPGSDLSMIPANVVARILPATVFGTSYVDLTTHGPQSTSALASGAIIPADSTQGTLELQQALDDIDSLVKAVGPAQLASAIGSAAQALDGRGFELGKTIDEANDYLGKLIPRMPQVKEDLSKLADNLEIVQQVAPDLLQATSDALVAARTIVTQKATIATIITGGTALTDQANGFLQANSADLIKFIDNSAVLLDVVYTNRHAGISEALVLNRLLYDKLQSIHQHGYLAAVAKFDLNVPPYYTTADCPRFGAAVGNNCSGASRISLSSMLGGGAG
jgi:phospholipid/cholesterol/gamma-HCH transport system substrate-binding protein